MAGSRTATTRASLILTLYVVALILPVELSIGPLAMSPLRMLLFLVLVPLAAGLLTGRYGRMLLVDWLFFLHVLWAMICVTYNNPARAVENVGSMAVEFLGGYLVARTQIRDKETFASFIKLLIVVIAITLPFAVLEAKTGQRVMIGIFKSVGFPTIGEMTVERRMGLARVQGPFDHPIHYGLFGSLVVTLIAVGLKERIAFLWRMIGAGIATAAVFLSLSSGALLAVAIQGMLVGWSILTARIQRNWLLLFALAGVGYVAIDIASNRTPIEVFMSRLTFSAHNAYYRSATNAFAWDNILNHPILGLGLNPWARPAWMRQGSIDNFWLVMAIRYGLPGLGLLIAGYLYAVYKVGFARLTDPGDISIRRAWMITFCGLIFTLTTVHVWSILYSYVFFFFGSCLWLVTAPTSTAETGAETEPPAPRDRAPRYSRFTPTAPAPADPPASAPAPLPPTDPVAKAEAAAYGTQYQRGAKAEPEARTTRHSRLSDRGNNGLE